ncbi:MAG: hypothetical protein L6Q66_12255 [Bacteroidia bacterium]|nr:hypothetical protein [Bacteroidia bacterium]
MGLNQNHTFEELGEAKCSIVEKNCNEERCKFLKELLEQNGYKVIIINSPPPKTVQKETEENNVDEKSNKTFTIGVTDLSFNVIKAIYNRELRTSQGMVVTPEYWKQKNATTNEHNWYWKKEN